MRRLVPSGSHIARRVGVHVDPPFPSISSLYASCCFTMKLRC